MLMKHPDFPNRKPVSVTKQAFTHVYSKNRWVEADTEDLDNTKLAVKNEAILDGIEVSPDEPLAGKSIAELREIANELGIDGADMGKVELRKLLEHTPPFLEHDYDPEA